MQCSYSKLFKINVLVLLTNANDVAFVIFNVKGKDLLAIDEPNPFESDEKRRETHALYEAMGMSTSPFKNVHYYYPYSKNGA